MATDEGNEAVAAWRPGARWVIALAATTGICAGGSWWVNRKFDAWIARQAAGQRDAALAQETPPDAEAASDSPAAFTCWRGGTMLLLEDLELQGVPSPAFRTTLRRIAPPRVGMLVEMAPAAYRYVPVKRDDDSDMRSVHVLGSAGMPAALLPASTEGAEYEEFGIYLAGRRLLESGDADGARSQWEALLGMPPEQRPWRSTWAAFMIGRSYQASDPAEAARWFRRTRDLAAEGYADSLGLAVASIGWEARTELDRGRTARAIALYLEQFVAGDPSAHPSLHVTMRDVVARQDFPLGELARDPVARAVVTAWAIANRAHRPDDGRWTDDFGERWCDALEREVKVPTPHDDLFAWLAQVANRPELVDRWVATARPDSDLVPWLRARIALRSGDRLVAMEALRALAERMPDSDGEEQWELPEPGFDRGWPFPSRKDRARAELGALLASEGDLEGALTQFLAAGDWSDAAYLAERVLTVDELECFVDALPTARSETERNTHGALRALLSRRLARLGRLDASMAYAPEVRRPALASLRDAMAAGTDPGRAPAERAAALREAARLTRTQGMELLGTELAPDGFVSGGSSSEEDMAACRAWFREQRLVRATDRELDRTMTDGTIPDHRFHYRWVAADLAWLAASLMPDDDPRTAEALCEGGRYLMYTDAPRADRFYKALVRRCGGTELGKEAERRRWFPKPAESPTDDEQG